MIKEELLINNIINTKLTVESRYLYFGENWNSIFFGQYGIYITAKV